MNSFCRIAAIGGVSCAIAGFAHASAAAEADQSYSPWSHWYVGAGLGAGFGAKFKLNGQSVSFDDALQGATDKSSLVAVNIVNAGIALSPSLLVGLSMSFVAQLGKIAGNDAHMQISNFFATATWFPAEQGFFVRGGAGPSSVLIDNGTTSNTTGGFGLLVGAGYALQIAGNHNITFTTDYSHPNYSRANTKPGNSPFRAVYLRYMYPR